MLVKGIRFVQNVLIKILQQCHRRNSSVVIITFRHDFKKFEKSGGKTSVKTLENLGFCIISTTSTKPRAVGTGSFIS